MSTEMEIRAKVAAEILALCHRAERERDIDNFPIENPAVRTDYLRKFAAKIAAGGIGVTVTSKSHDFFPQEPDWPYCIRCGEGPSDVRHRA